MKKIVADSPTTGTGQIMQLHARFVTHLQLLGAVLLFYACGNRASSENTQTMLMPNTGQTVRNVGITGYSWYSNVAAEIMGGRSTSEPFSFSVILTVACEEELHVRQIKSSKREDNYDYVYLPVGDR